MWLEQRKGYKESEIVITFTNTEGGKARERKAGGYPNERREIEQNRGR